MDSVLLDGLLADGIARGATQPAWLADARHVAADALARDGLPHARNEAWKYTSLRALAQRAHARGDASADARVVSLDRKALQGRADVCDLLRERAGVYLEAGEGDVADLDVRRV